MTIPIPCRLGEVYEDRGIKYMFAGVCMYRWSTGWDYTYVFEKPNAAWQSAHLLSAKDIPSLPCVMEIDDTLLGEQTIKETGHPLTGKGNLVGIKLKNGHTYAEFYISSHMGEHILSSCDDRGLYDGGDIIFPVTDTWSLPEKRAKAVTAAYRQTHDLVGAAGRGKQSAINDVLTESGRIGDGDTAATSEEKNTKSNNNDNGGYTVYEQLRLPI